MQNNATVTANKRSGVYVESGIFTMKGGTISKNTSDNGSGVIVSYTGTFIMEGGIISGNTTNGDGGGVFLRGGDKTFTKTGGTIYGSDAGFTDRNTARQGYAVYLHNSYGTARWRNATAGPDDNTDGYGFWLND
jgi:hypothetical protein